MRALLLVVVLRKCADNVAMVVVWQTLQACECLTLVLERIDEFKVDPRSFNILGLKSLAIGNRLFVVCLFRTLRTLFCISVVVNGRPKNVCCLNSYLNITIG